MRNPQNNARSLGFWFALTASLSVFASSCGDDGDESVGHAGAGGVHAAHGGASGAAAVTPGGDGGTTEGGAGAGAGASGEEGGFSGLGGFGGSAGEAGSTAEAGSAGHSAGSVSFPTPHGEPVVLDFDPSGNGEPASLYWSEAGDYLLIGDNRGNRIWKWTDAGGFEEYATTTGLPADPSPAGDGARDDVGQLVELADGTIVIARFGFQTHANVLWVGPGGTTKGELPGIDPKRRRVSLLVTPEQQLYSGYFSGPADARVAAVTKLAWPGAEGGASGEGGAGGAGAGSPEVDYAPGFTKPVGLLDYGDSILAVDQEVNKIYKLPKSETPLSPPHEVFAELPGPDQLAAGPDGSVFTGQFRGDNLAVRQISPEGEVFVFDDELSGPSGLAYDAERKRLFVADNNGTSVRQLRIYELE